MKIKEIYDFINLIAPFSSQCEWDNSGLLAGELTDEVNKIGFCLDATNQTVKLAKDKNCDLIITHHPIIFHPLKTVSSQSPLYSLISGGINIICAHTNLDNSDVGVNRVLAEKLGLKNIRRFESDNDSAMCFIGETDAVTPEGFAQIIDKTLNTRCKFYSDGKSIKTVAVCGGAGGEFALDIKDVADAFVTGEVRHHEFLSAADCGLSIYEAGHFETENPVMIRLMNMISDKFGIDCELIEQTEPAKFSGE